MEPDDLPLAGTVVLDFSQFLAGPVAALRLADLGARVIKIERPGTGEIGRTLAFAGRRAGGDTLSFHAMNRNKEAVVADLKDAADLARVTDLVARADVLIENFRPGVMARLGLDEVTARRHNPGLVYASASGYGDHGPWADRPGQDLLAQAVSGLTWVAGMDRPVTVGLSIADHLMSCHLAEGITALLVRRARTGRGGRIQTSLLEGMLDLQSERFTRAHLGAEAVDHAAEPPCLPAGIYATRDGHLALAMTPLNRLADRLGRPELRDLATTWWHHRDHVHALISDALRDESTDVWLRRLGEADGWCAPVRTLEEVLASPDFAALEMTQRIERPSAAPDAGPLRLWTTRSPIRIDGEVLRDPRGAPRLGEHGALRDGADPLGGSR